MRGKKWDIQWPLSAEMVEAINANFDVLFRLIGSTSATAAATSSSGGGGGSSLPDPVTPAHGGTGLTSVSVGALLLGLAGNAWGLFPVGDEGQFARVHSGSVRWETVSIGDVTSASLPAGVRDAGYYAPLTTGGDPASSSLVMNDAGECIMVWVSA